VVLVLLAGCGGGDGSGDGASTTAPVGTPAEYRGKMVDAEAEARRAVDAARSAGPVSAVIESRRQAAAIYRGLAKTFEGIKPPAAQALAHGTFVEEAGAVAESYDAEADYLDAACTGTSACAGTGNPEAAADVLRRDVLSLPAL
jgi:hypothetical protein